MTKQARCQQEGFGGWNECLPPPPLSPTKTETLWTMENGTDPKHGEAEMERVAERKSNMIPFA